MGATWRCALTLTGLLASVLVAGATTAEPTVIVLSWDGVAGHQIDRAQLPGLTRVAREGVRAETLTPPFPSSTFPSHATLATGTYPDRHGIVANHFIDPMRSGDTEFDYDADANWFEAEPLWIAAERQGVRSAVFFWVGAETDWRGQRAQLRRAPFDSGVDEREKVDQILAWLDLPEDERPRLILSYWRGSDRAGHRHGPDSEEVDRALRGQDAQLVRLLAGLDAREAWPDTTLLIVSDHGMTEVTEAVDAGAVIKRAGVNARVIHSSAVANIHLDAPSDPGAKRRAIAAFDGIEGVVAHDALRTPAALRYRHPSRVGQVVAIARPPVVFRSGLRGWGQQLSWALGGSTGAHGFEPDSVPRMGAVLLAVGRGTGQGARLPAARAIDIAATVAALLGIDPPAQSEGRAIDLRGEPPKPSASPTTAGQAG
jgi:arylsulfatase A-like enzyme